MKKKLFIFMIVVGTLLGPFAFSQSNGSSIPDPIDAFLNEEKNRVNNQTPDEMFQDYINDIALEKQAFQQALSEMLQFLENIEKNEIWLSDVNRMKKRISEASDDESENNSAFSKKKDRIVESLEQCMERVSEVNDEGNQTPVEQFQDYENEITLEREAFQRAISIMSNLLESIQEGEVRRSALNSAKSEILKESDFLDDSVFDLDEDEDDFGMFAEDRIFEFLEQCVNLAPKTTPSS